ncbi:SDR family NAD(P)-dependent oxidoreductase [Nonomuraea sp. NPDC003201]
MAATARDTARLRENLGEDASSDSFLPLQVDLADASSIDSAVHRAVEHFGSIDVLVNNAGYGLLGSVEETSDAEARAMFDINFFGLWNVTRAPKRLRRKSSRSASRSLSSSPDTSGPASSAADPSRCPRTPSMPTPRFAT